MTDRPPTRVVQLSRRKGASHPEGMVKVDRSGPWGNPFRLGRSYTIHQGLAAPSRVTVSSSSARVWFDRWLERDETGWAIQVEEVDDAQREWIVAHVHELAGLPLGCWCSIDDQGCHARSLAHLADLEAYARDLAAVSACTVEEARRIARALVEAGGSGG